MTECVKPPKMVIKIRVGKYGLPTVAVKRNSKKNNWCEVNLVEQKI